MPFETAGNIENRAFLIGYIVMLLGLFWQVLEKKNSMGKKIAKLNYFDVLLSSLFCGTPMDGGHP